MSNQPKSRKGEGLEPAELAAWLRKQAKDADLEMMFGTADRFRAAADLLTRSETGQVVTSRTSADLRRFFDRVAEESLGDYPWKVETALLAVYRLGREDERGEREGG